MDFLKRRSLWALFLVIGLVTAHGGHESVPEGETISQDPIVCRPLPYHGLRVGLLY